MDTVQKIYESLWGEAIPRFMRGECSVDPFLSLPKDGRRGLTLRIRPDAGLIDRIGVLRQAFRHVLPGQYYTPDADLHLTVLSLIGCHEGFACDTAAFCSYADLVAECVAGVGMPRIVFKGITASPSCLLLCGHPENRWLDEIRNRLRARIAASGLHHTIDGRYPARTAHITLMRFQSQPTHLGGFVELLRAHRERAFGTLDVATLELVHNDWYHRRSNTTVLQSFGVGGSSPSAGTDGEG